MAPASGDVVAPGASQTPGQDRSFSPLLQQGLKFLESGDALGADLLLETYLARNPSDADAQNIAGLAKRALGQTDASAERLRTAVALNAREPLYAINLAMLLGENGRGEEALAVLDSLLMAVPGQIDALIQRATQLRRMQRFDEAVATARMAVAFHRSAARAHHALGMCLMKVAQFNQAADTFAEASRLDPAHVETWINRGVALKESGDLQGAEASYRHALALSPHDAVIHNNLANALVALGRGGEAIALYRKAVDLDPSYADAKANLGLAVRDAGDIAEALTLLAEAIAEHPSHALLLNTYGNTLRQADRVDEAISTLQHAIALSPAYAEAHNNLALAYAVHSQLELAAAHFKHAVALRPDMAVISNNYGALLVRMFRFEEAVVALSNAVARQPDYDEALTNLGVAHYMLGHADEAMAVYKKVLVRAPDNAFAHYSLGVTYLEDQRLEEAEAEIRLALKLDPKNAMALNTLGVLLLEQHYVTEAREAMHAAAMINTRSAPVFYSNYAFASLYEPHLENAEIFDIHKEYGRRFATAEPDRAKPHANARDRERKLRVGYMSPDFRAHSVSFFFEAILEKHDRSSFEVFLYSDTTRSDVVTKAMQAGADHWVETGGLTDEAFARCIAADGIDILVNLGGHTSGNRMPVCALKPAPVQIEYLGYPDTSGVPAMDYRVTDERADPPGTEQWCTEQILRLPRVFHCYRPAGKPPIPAPAPHIAKGFVTFASFNVLPKVTDQAIEAWAEILKAVPQSRFYMKCKQLRDTRVRDRVVAAFAAYGVDPARIDTAAFVPSIHEHLSRYAQVDLALDTFPYNGTTTTCESLYMGVPVLTMRGDNHRGRVGLSLLNAMGMEQEFVADNVKDYIARAVAWGRNPAHLAEIRPHLRQRMEASPLRDEIGLTRDLEAAYRAAWRTWCEGPATFMFKSPPKPRSEDSLQGVLVKTF